MRVSQSVLINPSVPISCSLCTDNRETPASHYDNKCDGKIFNEKWMTNDNAYELHCSNARQIICVHDL